MCYREGDEIIKIDKGSEFSYWNLSYRRKLIRTLWIIPVVLITSILIYFVYDNMFIKVVLILSLAIIMVIQLIYNCVNYIREKRYEG